MLFFLSISLFLIKPLPQQHSSTMSLSVSNKEPLIDAFCGPVLRKNPQVTSTYLHSSAKTLETISVLHLHDGCRSVTDMIIDTERNAMPYVTNILSKDDSVTDETPRRP
jgi:hypothetical protein